MRQKFFQTLPPKVKSKKQSSTKNFSKSPKISSSKNSYLPLFRNFSKQKKTSKKKFVKYELVNPILKERLEELKTKFKLFFT